MSDIHIGDLLRVTVAWTNQAKEAADPTTVTLLVFTPDGIEHVYTYAKGEVEKSSTGNYYKDITIDQAQTWYYRWAATGTVTATEPGGFYVKAHKF